MSFSIQYFLIVSLLVFYHGAVIAAPVDICNICSCRGSEVDCRGRGISSLENLKFPPTATSIDLCSNSFRSVPSEAFKTAPKLKNLLLGLNQIQVVANGAFDGTQVAYVNLQNNALVTLGVDTFLGADKLRLLVLEGNPISYLPQGWFGGLSNDTTL